MTLFNVQVGITRNERGDLPGLLSRMSRFLFGGQSMQVPAPCHRGPTQRTHASAHAHCWALGLGSRGQMRVSRTPLVLYKADLDAPISKVRTRFSLFASCEVMRHCLIKRKILAHIGCCWYSTHAVEERRQSAHGFPLSHCTRQYSA